MQTMTEEIAVERKPRIRRPNGTPRDPMIGFYASPDLVKAVKAEAAKRGIAYSAVAREAVETFICALANERERMGNEAT